MSDEEKSTSEAGFAAATASVPSEQPSLDEHTTEPNAPEPVKRVAAPQSAEKWQMPKPKFQQTSGYLPQGYLKEVDLARVTAGSEDTTREQAPYKSAPDQDGSASAVAAPAVEPQPDITEIIRDDADSGVAATPAPAKPSSGLPVIVLVLAGIAAFVLIFLVAVYFLFLKQPSAGSGF